MNFKLEYQKVFWDLRLGFCSKKYIKTEENEVHNKINWNNFPAVWIFRNILFGAQDREPTTSVNLNKSFFFEILIYFN